MEKKTLIIIVILLIVYTLFVNIDCYRLRNSKRNTRPLITFSIKEYETDSRIGTFYSGLGYTVEYYNIKNTMGYGTNIKLFNIITLFGVEAQ